MLVHALTLVLVVTFLWLGWWQFGRAASGNLLSYGYTIQWPAFAAFVIFVWYKEVKRALADTDQRESTEPHRDGDAHAGTPARPGQTSTGGDTGWPLDPTGAGSLAGAERAPAARSAARGRRARDSNPLYDDSDDPELAAYNRYLAWLNANPHANPADYPGH